jgi:hypothetical protein
MRRGSCSGNTAGRRGPKDRLLKRFHIRHTVTVEDAFGYVLFGTVIIAAIVAVLSLKGPRYDHIGRGGLFEDEPARAKPQSSAVLAAERDDEIRQMVSAKNARRAARGEAPLDVDAEIDRITGTQPQRADPALVAEVRDLVIARNARRARQGKEPLDVEEEIQRQLRDLLG